MHRRSSRGASVPFVTHHIDEAMALADRVVVFTARPGTIKSIVPIDLPRPRDPRDPQLHELRDHLRRALRCSFPPRMPNRAGRVSAKTSPPEL